MCTYVCMYVCMCVCVYCVLCEIVKSVYLETLLVILVQYFFIIKHLMYVSL